MGTTKKTTTTSEQKNTYDPAALAQYQSGVQQGGGVLAAFMNDPYKNAYFLQQLGLINKQALGLGQRGVSNLWQNATAGGMSGNNLSSFMAANLARQGRATSGLQAGGLNALLPQFAQMRMGAAQTAMGFTPLQTGGTMNSTQTQKTSGLGTWLPQVIGAGLAIAGAPFTGGASLMGLASGNMFPTSGGGAAQFPLFGPTQPNFGMLTGSGGGGGGSYNSIPGWGGY